MENSNKEYSYEELEKISDNDMEDLNREIELLRCFFNNWSLDVEWFAMDRRLYVQLENIHKLLMNIGRAFKKMSETKIPVKIVLNARYHHLEHLFVMFNIRNTIRGRLEKYAEHSRDRKKSVRDGNIYGLTADLTTSIDGLEGLREKSLNIDLLAEEINDVVDEYRNVQEILVQANDILREYYYYDGAMLRIMSKNGSTTDDEIRETAMADKLIQEYMLDMAKRMERDVYKRIKNQVVLLKENRSDKLTERHWSEMLELEERAMKLAVKGELVSSEDELLSKIYDEAEKKEMEKMARVVEGMLEIFTDDELFESEKLDKPGSAPNSNNIEFIVRYILRGNIIRSEMNSDLKREYEAWMGREMPENVKIEDEEDDGESVLRSARAMRMWKKLQAADLIDEDLMPKVSNPKAAIIASVMSDKLGLDPRWKAFEDLWEIDDLANKLARAQTKEYYDEFLKKIENLLK